MSNNFEERLRLAAEPLESLAKNRELLANVSEEGQCRVLRAAGEVFEPDDAARRGLIKAMRRHIELHDPWFSPGSLFARRFCGIQ